MAFTILWQKQWHDAQAVVDVTDGYAIPFTLS